MFEIAQILLFIMGVVVGGACLAPPLWWLGQWGIAVDWVPQLQPFTFDKYLNRALLISALAGMPVLLRKLRLRSWADLGIAPNPLRLRDLTLGLALALGGFAMLMLALLADGHLQWHGAATAKAWVLAVVGAAVVAILEELLFRGVFFGVLRRSLPAPAAVAFLSVLFAALHYLRPNPAMPRPRDVTWASGFALLPHLAWEFSQPQRLWAAMLTLGAMAAVLCYTVLRTRSLFCAVGLHGGWVLGVKALGMTTVRRHGADMWLGDDLRSGLAPLALMLGTGGILWLSLRNRPNAALAGQRP